MGSIFRFHLLEGARGLGGWAVSMLAVIGIYLPMYPSMTSPELRRAIDSLPPALVEMLGYDQITSGAGYAQATFFGLVGYALMQVAAVFWGAHLIAGIEESGRLDVILARAVSRRAYLFASAGALAVRVVALGVLVAVAIAALNGPAQLTLDLGHVVLVVASWCGLGALTGATALALGAWTGRVAVARLGGAGLAVASYVANAVHLSVDKLEGLGTVSPFTWVYGAQPLASGEGTGACCGVWILAAVVVTVGAWAFDRRDLVRG